MGSIFWVLVEAIPDFVKVFPKRGVENLKYWLVARLGFVNSPWNGFEILFEVLVSGQTRLCRSP